MVAQDVERILLGLDTRWNRTEFLMKFNATDGGINNGEFMYLVGDWPAGYVQGGHGAELCEFLNSTEFMNDPIQAFIDDCNRTGLTVDNYDSRILSSTTIDTYASTRQWVWQQCFEIGGFQGPNPTYSLRGQIMDHDFWIGYCERLYGQNQTGPNIAHSQKYYGSIDMAASNIAFVNSVEDPWKFGCMRYRQDPLVTQKNIRTYYVDCPGCAHCSDIHLPKATDSHAMNNTRAAVEKQIEEWMELTS